MSCSELLPMLTPLYQLIDERLTVFKPLLKLVGRMQMLQAQIASQAAAGRLDGTAKNGPLLTFDEEEEEARAAEEDGDGNDSAGEAGGGDDEEDDGEESDDEDDDLDDDGSEDEDDL